MFKKTFVSLICIVAITGCGERQNNLSGATVGTLSLALEEAVNKKILPTASGFSSQATSFKSTAEGFCNTPSTTTLDALQQAWKSLSAQWYKLAIYNFGPVNNDLIFPRINFIDSLRLRGTNYKATVRDEITKNLASDATLDTTFFDNKNFNRVGLLALESLVFETAASEHSNVGLEIIAEYENSARKCEILKGLSSQIVKHATDIQNGWNVNHNETGKPFKTIFLNDELESGTPALTELIASIQGHLDYLQKRHVATVAAQISDYSWESITASIDEVDALLNGTQETTVSYFGLMTAAGFQSAVDQVKENIIVVRQNLQAEDATLLEISLGKLDGNLKREIPDGLEVQLGINFTDGD